MSTTFTTLLESADHSITKTEATAMIERFLANKADLLSGKLDKVETMPNSESFDMAAIVDLTKVTDAVAVRIYYGMNAEKQVKLILKSLDEDGNPINSTIIERGLMP